jgi:hypothetical protein
MNLAAGLMLYAGAWSENELNAEVLAIEPGPQGSGASMKIAGRRFAYEIVASAKDALVTVYFDTLDDEPPAVVLNTDDDRPSTPLRENAPEDSRLCDAPHRKALVNRCDYTACLSSPSRRRRAGTWSLCPLKFSIQRSSRVQPLRSMRLLCLFD